MLFVHPNTPSNSQSFEQMMKARRVQMGLPPQKVVVVKPTNTGILRNPVRVGK